MREVTALRQPAENHIKRETGREINRGKRDRGKGR
jgi:hypothetical protein